MLMRYLSAFGRFWWEFLVGDTPELFVATLALVGLALALHRVAAAAVPVLIVAAVACVSVSAWRGRRRQATPPEKADGP
jgi:hypothetical protein